MNTPPPDEPNGLGLKESSNGASNGTTNGASNGAPNGTPRPKLAARALLDSDEEMMAHTPGPQSTKSFLPPRDIVHCACAHHGEGHLALMLRTIDFAAWVSCCART